MGVYRRRGRGALSGLVLAGVGPRRGKAGVGRRCTCLDRRGRRDRAYRERAPHPSISDLHGYEPWLWGFSAGAVGQRRRRSETDEQDRRNRRCTRLRDRRAGRVVFRSLSTHPRSRAEPVDRHARPGLGQRHRQRTRPRRGLHVRRLPRPLLFAQRYGSRRADRRDHPHGHGCPAGRQDLGRIPLRIWSLRGWAVLARQRGHRHEDGHSLDARAGSVFVVLRARAAP